MNKMLYRLYLSIFCFMALLVAGPLGTAWSEDDLSEGQRLRKLESTQTGEARRLDKVADEVAWLLADLESNGLLEQGDGAKVENLKEVLGTVADTHLPAAAEHLRSARLEPTESKHHLTSADEEVGLVLEQLANVLAESSTLLAEEELVRELRDLIKEQTYFEGRQPSGERAC